MRATNKPCFSPDGMSSSNVFTTVFHRRGDCVLRHDDDAVTTIILQAGQNSGRSFGDASLSHDDHSHDEGLVHAHSWATNGATTH